MAERAVLHGLLEDATGDIVVRVDAAGFIVTASPNMADIGYDLSQLLLKPHLADLASPGHAQALKERVGLILAGRADPGASADWIEFPVSLMCEDSDDSPQRRTVWYALSLRAITGEDGRVTGALGLLRCLGQSRLHEGDVQARAQIDPLTGIGNRRAACGALARLLEDGESGTLALFEVDRMRAIFMQYGQRTVDEIVWGFARFLETMVQDDFELAQFDAERFCMILPGMEPRASCTWAQGVLQTFGTLAISPSTSTSTRGPCLSASSGIAPIHSSVDATLRQAELALVMARAQGGMRAAQCIAPDTFAAYALSR